jgi:hypothetical protein
VGGTSALVIVVDPPCGVVDPTLGDALAVAVERGRRARGFGRRENREGPDRLARRLWSA